MRQFGKTHALWERVRQEAVHQKPIRLTTDAMRNETMKQIVLQEFGRVVVVDDFSNSLVRFVRDGVDPNSIVISWKSGLLEPDGTVLTLAWDDNTASLCATDPGSAVVEYAIHLESQYSDRNPEPGVQLQHFSDNYANMHLQLTKKLTKAKEWHEQFWPYVKDMIMLVFRHSMFRASLSEAYGEYNVVTSQAVLGRHRQEISFINMIVGSPHARGIKFYFKQIKNGNYETPVVSIRSARQYDIDESTTTSLLAAITTLIPMQKQTALRFFIAKPSHHKCWHFRFRFETPEDMAVLLQAVKILRDHNAFSSPPQTASQAT
jgi:hypothetical protein